MIPISEGLLLKQERSPYAVVAVMSRQRWLPGLRRRGADRPRISKKKCTTSSCDKKQICCGLSGRRTRPALLRAPARAIS